VPKYNTRKREFQYRLRYLALELEQAEEARIQALADRSRLSHEMMGLQARYVRRIIHTFMHSHIGGIYVHILRSGLRCLHIRVGQSPISLNLSPFPLSLCAYLPRVTA
jgi:hypothetical protein